MPKRQKSVTSDAEVLGGVPTLAGTRIPVRDIAAALAAGQSVARIRAAYPGLTKRQIETARVYVMANPASEPSPGLIELQPELQLVMERKVPRQARD